MIVLKFGKRNFVGFERPDQFLTLDEFINSKSKFIMCEHEELLNCGEYVCIKCGIVLGQEYILEENSFKQQFNENKDSRKY